MGLFDRLRSLVAGAGLPSANDDAPFRCLKCGMGHDREHQTCPSCGGSFVVPNTSDEPTARDAEEPPWR
jgi:lipopolysaccharide biosynthesis regulator YciM